MKSPAPDRQLVGCRVDAVLLDGTLHLSLRTAPSSWAGLDVSLCLEVDGPAPELVRLADTARDSGGEPVTLVLPSDAVVRVLPGGAS